MKRPAQRPWSVVVGSVSAGLVAGTVLGGSLLSVAFDGVFWRDFWTGPPAAGVFAVIGAGIAYGAARVAARTARLGAARQEWWDRAEWALNLARSDTEADRAIGLRALRALELQATEVESEMIVAVTEAVYGDVSNVDVAMETSDNGSRRWFGWLRRSA